MPLLVLEIQRKNLEHRLARQYQRILIAVIDESSWLRCAGEPIELMKHEAHKTINALENVNDQIKNHEDKWKS
jgi:hypothetical protein